MPRDVSPTAPSAATDTESAPPGETADLPVRICEDWLIPVEPGHAVDEGWLPHTQGRPVGVTWHWTATASLLECSRLIGGPQAARRGVASAHYGIGRTREEGIARYVSLENRSWHAGRQQTLRWDGQLKSTEDWKGARTTIGVETTNLGFAGDHLPAGPDWRTVDTPDGRQRLQIQPWTEAQLRMMIQVGREIVERWPTIRPQDHHGHHDLCPGYKLDVCGFPFAEVLRGIYRDPSIPDVWSPYWLNGDRRAALAELGYGDGVASEAPTHWGLADDIALRRFQMDHDLPPVGVWTTATSWRIHAARRLA
ncbi:MAG: N-acetylmuramoyl-L-alanine amidase [Acidobacteriota bacterium]